MFGSYINLQKNAHQIKPMEEDEKKLLRIEINEIEIKCSKERINKLKVCSLKNDIIKWLTSW